MQRAELRLERRERKKERKKERRAEFTNGGHAIMNGHLFVNY